MNNMQKILKPFICLRKYFPYLKVTRYSNTLYANFYFQLQVLKIREKFNVLTYWKRTGNADILVIENGPPTKE